MTRTNEAEMVRAILGMRGLKVEEMIAALGERFPDCRHDQLERAFAIARDQLLEKHDEDERELRGLKLIQQLLEGFPEGTMLDEAVALKAQKGDPLALLYISQTQTKERRTYFALAEAAYTAHPLFSGEPGGIFRWHGVPDEPPSEAALVDWFQKTHPTEARRIEGEVL